ncbi:MAG TPA: phosphoglucosamine mutase [Kosmotogaceae bacterium]|nr:MAG: Phosphoglucosamine mutase [Thermotogales bacterium 46_20]HAA86305.1 phosphoglucosamine mutase [Kosmotogaceae bacterium]
MKKLFGTDGVRGVVNEELTPELALKIGNAAGRFFLGRYDTLLIAKDTRNSGDSLEAALASGAASAGMNVQLVGVLPTPGLAYCTKRGGFLGAVISASHNPAVYNGIKLIADGKKISDEEEVEIENLLTSVPLHYSVFSKIGRISSTDRHRNDYIEHITNLFKDKRFTGLRILVDAANGAVVSVVREVFDNLDIDAEYVSMDPDGININEDCGSMHHEMAGRLLKDEQVGFLFDGDADRCLIVLRGNRLFDGDMIMALNALKMKNTGRLQNAAVVSTVMSNLGFERFLADHGIRLIRTRVGDKYVLEKMLETSSNLGGEQSGHVIFLDRSTTGDGVITALETMDSLKEMHTSLRGFVDQFPVFPQTLKNVPVANRRRVMENEKLKAMLAIIKEDPGLRVVVRPSGTEPLVRVMVEGENEKEVHSTAERLVEIIEEANGE